MVFENCIGAAIQASIITELRRYDLDAMGGDHFSVVLHGLSDAAQEEVHAAHDSAAEDDQLRGKENRNVQNCECKVCRDFFHDGESGCVSHASRLEDHTRADLFAVSLGHFKQA